jgi:hypothetical protein
MTNDIEFACRHHHTFPRTWGAVEVAATSRERDTFPLLVGGCLAERGLLVPERLMKVSPLSRALTRGYL